VRLFVGFAIFAGFFIGIGNLTANKPVEYRNRDIPGPTVTKTEPPVTNTVRYIPESCKTAMALSNRRVKAAGVLDNASAEQLDIISKARRELASTNQLNDLETQQRRLSARVVAAVLEMSNTDKQYAEAYATCQNESE
jgi:hypothetical protein